MQRAYLVYSSSLPDKVEDSSSETRLQWIQKIQQSQSIHFSLVQKLKNNEKIVGIEKDPMENKEDNFSEQVLPGELKNEEGELILKPFERSLKEAEDLLKKEW